MRVVDTKSYDEQDDTTQQQSPVDTSVTEDKPEEGTFLTADTLDSLARRSVRYVTLPASGVVACVREMSAAQVDIWSQFVRNQVKKDKTNTKRLRAALVLSCLVHPERTRELLFDPDKHDDIDKVNESFCNKDLNKLFNVCQDLNQIGKSDKEDIAREKPNSRETTSEEVGTVLRDNEE